MIKALKNTAKGYTLIEALLSVFLLGMLTTAIAGGLVAGLRVFNQTNDTTTQAVGASKTAMFFTWDAKRAWDVTTTSECGTGSDVVSFNWEDNQGEQTAAWKVTEQGGKKLMRARCTNGKEQSVVFLGDVDDTPTLTCTPSKACPGEPDAMSLSWVNGKPWTIQATRGLK